MKKTIYKYSLLVITLLYFNHSAYSINPDNSSANHELTIYVMPTLLPLNWDSPSMLYKSMKDCYIKTLNVKDNYLLGHVTVKLETPLLPEPLITAQTSASPAEKVDLVLNKKIGFGILGATLKGKLENDKDIKHRLKVYAERNKLSFIKYRISEKAAERIIQFINRYSEKINSKHAACDFYGGVFYPLNKNEGSGCSAFGIALLDVINALNDDANNWKVTRNIPMDIIGGEFNHNKKIKNKSIIKAEKWHDGNGVRNVDYYVYNVYEPSIMHNWILSKADQKDSLYKVYNENNVKGLYVDVSNVEIPENTDLFKQRTETDIFIEHFKKTKLEDF